MNWKELILDQNGTLSHTKLWSNVGMATLTVTYCISVYMHGITPELILAYGGVVVFGRATSKYIDTKGNNSEVTV